MRRRLEDALQDCLAALETGRATVDDCLARYPDLARDLEPLLRMGQRLQEVYRVEPSPLYAQAARQRFLAALTSRRQRALARTLAAPRRVSVWGRPRRALWRWAPAALGSVALLVFGTWAGILALSSSSVTSPNDVEIAFNVPPPTAEPTETPRPMVSIMVAEAQQHFEEIREAVEKGKPVDPATLQDLKEANKSLVDGLAPGVSEEDLSQIEVLLAEQQELFPDLEDAVPPEASDDLEELIGIAGEGLTKLGELRSPTATVTPEASPTPEGTPSATPEATSTPAPSPTPTPEATPAETPQPSPTPEAEVEATQEATPTPTAAP